MLAGREGGEMQTIAERRHVERAGLGDAALVALARAGDEAAIRAIVQRHNRRLFRVARAVLHDDVEAEDVVQDTYLRAFSRLEAFRGDAALSTWLTRIALNEALGRLRRRRPMVDLEKLLEIDEALGTTSMTLPRPTAGTDPEADAARGELRAVLEQAVDELPEAFRLVFVLRTIEEMSTEETAQHLGIKPEAVKTRLFRAHRLLRGALDRRIASTFTELFPFGGARCDAMAERVLRRVREQS
jgi:RNA polymerase sigma-70 factor (ECF subfamily)